MDLVVATPRLLRPSPDLLTSPLGESSTGPRQLHPYDRLEALKLRLTESGVSEDASALILSATRKIPTLHTRRPEIFGDIVKKGATQQLMSPFCSLFYACCKPG
ncbi:hypothetical protein OUZ56_011996 [Daphnia magna]|uniref:Uncharacterized protein n=1 Tax=Daphnia magna TaxID=35525 RepID=A0ABQ9Z1R4_9CRUS|nr:hypothetical protein OUZ56_011996 [Daphnia magna]